MYRYHIFHIKCVVGMEVEVKRETRGVDDEALVCYVPQELPDDIGSTRMTSKSTKQSYLMREKVGKPVGRMQYFLNKAIVDLLEKGIIVSIKGYTTEFIETRVIFI